MSARFGRLAEEYPHLDSLDGDEVGMLLPKDMLQPAYEEGLRRAQEQAQELSRAQSPVGQIANGGANISIAPVPAAA